MNLKIPASQMTAWLLVATLAPALCVVGRSGWLTVLAVAVLCGILCFCTWKYGTGDMPAWLCVLEILWLAVILGSVGRISGTSWKETDAIPIIPGVLMFIAALGVQRGGDGAARSGATLIWLVLPILLIVLLAGTADGDFRWVRTGLCEPDERLVSVLLLPCLCIFLPRQKTAHLPWGTVIVGTVTIAASVLMDATMGAEVAAGAANTFYEFSKGVSLLGIARRFEALVACALTGGWFAFFTVAFSAAYHLGEKISPRGGKWCVWVCAGLAIGILCILPKGLQGMAIGSLIFWVFLPLLTQGLGGRKKVEKR